MSGENVSDDRKLELARITLSVIFIGGLIAGSFWILAPFLAAFIWATMIVVATWPMLLRVQRFLGGRRAPATALMTLALLGILILPLIGAINTLLSHTDDLASLATRLRVVQIPPVPDWVARVPVVGERATEAWTEAADAGPAELVKQAEPYLRSLGKWFAQNAGSFLLVILQFLLVAVLTAILYSGGEKWGAWARGFGRRLAFQQGEHVVILAGQAIRGVALGVVVTAVIQTLFSGLGLAIVGVPYAGVLTAIIFMLCVAQLGPILVLLGAAAWAFVQLGAGWGTFMLVWAVVVGLMDNFLRPVLIRKGADLPLLLIFAGVVGGLVAFGVVGIFVGPVVLAVTYRLLDDWVAHVAAQEQEV
jgi:predicted PurR-regulated permease PerM